MNNETQEETAKQVLFWLCVGDATEMKRSQLMPLEPSYVQVTSGDAEEHFRTTIILL